jgi:hypothetical protein
LKRPNNSEITCKVSSVEVQRAVSEYAELVVDKWKTVMINGVSINGFVSISLSVNK